MRIVSLCPSLTELVFELGCGGDLVGVTRFCVHPADRVGGIEKVGGTKNPKLDRIVSLAPDLVLLNEEENRREDADALAAAGLRCLTTFPKDCTQAAAMVRQVGAGLQRLEAAEAIAADIEERSRRVREDAAARPLVRFAYLIWRNPLMAANADTYVHALLAQAGGRNVFAGKLERYPEIGLAEMAAADTELVLLGTEPFPFSEAHADELASLTALPRERFVIADGEALSWHGSRTPAGIDYAALLIAAAREALV